MTLNLALLLMLDGLKCEVVQFNLPCTQLLRVFQDTGVKTCTGRDLSDRPPKTQHSNAASVPRLSALIMPELWGKSSLALPVLVDEALVLCERIDGRQGRRHLPVDLHHLMLQQRRDVEILLQDLLPWSRWCEQNMKE